MVFASQEAGSSSYDGALLQGVFLHSVPTGLRDSSVKAEMRPHLKTQGISDEDLLEHLNNAATNEEESRLKLHVRKTTPLNEVQTNLIETETLERLPKKENPLIKEVQASSADISLLKAQIAEIRDVLLRGQPNTNQGRSRPRGCKACQKTSNGATCSHCFKCGSAEHFIRGCRLNRRGPPQADWSGNGGAARPRGRE